jgi:hypothetical protein
MRRIVRSEARLAWALGALGGLAAGLFDAGPGATYLIALGLGAIGLGVILGPDRVRLWREMHGQGRRF